MKIVISENEILDNFEYTDIDLNKGYIVLKSKKTGTYYKLKYFWLDKLEENYNNRLTLEENITMIAESIL